MMARAALGRRGVAWCVCLLDANYACSSSRGNTGYVGLIIDFHIDSFVIYLYSFLSLSRARSHSLVLLLLLNVHNIINTRSGRERRS